MIIRYYVNQALADWVRSNRNDERSYSVVMSVLLVVFLCVSATIYFGLVSGLRHVQGNEFLQLALPAFMYEVLLASIFVLAFCGSLIIGAFSFFSRPTDQVIMASPVFDTILFYKLVAGAVTSLWPLLVLAVPMVLAMNAVYSLEFVSGTLAVVAIVSVGASAVIAANLLLVSVGLIVSYWGQTLKHRMRTLLASLLFVTISLGAAIVWPLRTASLKELFQVDNLAITTASPLHVTEAFAHLPSHFAAMALVHIQLGEIGMAGLYTMMVVMVFLLACLLYALFSWRILYIWQYFQEDTFFARAQKTSSGQMSADRFADSPIQALVQQSITVLKRSPRDLFWLGFLSLLWVFITVLDIGLQREVANGETGQTLAAPELLSVFQLLVVSYFIAAFVLRFVLPSFSLEQETGWVIRRTPTTLSQIFAARALVYVAGAAILTVLILILNLSVLTLTASASIWFIVFSLGQALTITWCGYCIGVAYPNFNTKDPQLIATTVPGLGFTMGALLYGAYGSWLLYLVYQGLLVEAVMTFVFLSFTLLTIATWAAALSLQSVELEPQRTS